MISRLGDREIQMLPPGEAAFAATVDVEDWFHTNYTSAPALDPDTLPRRVEAGMDRVLQAFAAAGARGTFFVLGCVARDHPRLVPRIASAGHEIACHGMAHTLVYEQQPGAFKDGVSDARRLLEDQSGQAVLGFRAPSWSLTLKSLWAFDALAEAGFRYDSSVFPAGNYLYGITGAPRAPYRVPTTAGPLVEAPPPALALGPWRIGVGGGFYLRALPLWVHRWAMRDYARAGSPFPLYIHPRELDPEAWSLSLPLSFGERMIHDWAIAAVPGRIRRLLSSRRWEPLGAILRRRGLLP